MIRLSFADGVLHNGDALETKVIELLAQNEARHAVTPQYRSLSGRFHGLIEAVSANYAKPAVVLVIEPGYFRVMARLSLDA